jgi:hypothetical protein
MSLSVVGRYNISGGQRPYGPVQDPNDLDSMYFIMSSGGEYWLYKFTWPSTLVQVVNLNAYLAGYTFNMAAIADDESTILGQLSADLHYCIAGFKSSNQAKILLDVNLSDNSITSYVPTAGYVGYSGRTFVAYTDSGTYFYTNVFISGGYQYWYRKRLGLSSGDSLQDNNLYAVRDVFWIDTGGFFGYTSGSDWRSLSLSLVPLGIPLSGTPMIAPGAAWGIYSVTMWPYMDYLDNVYGGYPQLPKGWDDNWQYGFGSGYVSAERRDLLFYRKNVVTLQYQAIAVIEDTSVNGASGYDAAFDIWQTGDDASQRRMFFSFGGSGGRVYSSLTWPPAVDSSAYVDTGSVVVTSLHTANEYVYAIHYGGDAQGTCITKLMESELVAGEAEPSIGGIGARLLFKDKRVFFIGVPNYGKYLWWGQPMEPQALDVGWDGFNTTVFDDEDNTSLNTLDDNIYVGSQKGFIRLRGKNPDSWVLDQTLATTGPLSDKTSSVTPFGLIYPRENGLWLFNGFTSTLFFEKGKNLLSNVNWDEYARAFSLWDGRYYRLYYPSGTAIENDRELVIDLIGGIENARGTEGDRAATFGFADLTTNTVYLGDASGNLMTLGGTAASRAFSLTTKEYPCGPGLIEAGSFSALHYDIDLAGATLSIIPICDGVEKTAITITNSARTRSKVSLPKGNFYRMGFRFEVTTAAAVKFYDPWYIE